MIYQRFAANLRAQNWFAIAIEFAIVVAGVFVGTLVANANQDRLQRKETRRLLVQIKPDLKGLTDVFRNARHYYATTRRYADTALAGWRADRRVSDRDFVIAAYQASQIIALTIDSETWASIMGADQIRSLDDADLRRKLSLVLYADYAPLQLGALDTPYRKNVRRLIPLELQEQIRDRCGDQKRRSDGMVTLPETCDLTVEPAMAAAVATKLRAHPDLADDLAGHFAVIAVLLSEAQGSDRSMRALSADIDNYVGGQASR